VAVLVLISRILFVAIFATAAVGHLTQSKGMAGFAASKKIPYALLSVIGSGVLLALGTLSVLLGVWGDLGALLLLLFLVVTTPTMHNFWTHTDPMTKAGDQSHFFKNVSLAGATLAIFALFSYAGSDLGLTITGPLFDIR
jgi:putative oxidoreductase